MQVVPPTTNEDLPETQANVHTWLWGDRYLSDLKVSLVQNGSGPEQDARSPVTDTLGDRVASAELASLPHDHEQAGHIVDTTLDSAAKSASSSPGSSLSTPLTAAKGSVFHLHVAVLCSYSAYFRARLTTAVGAEFTGSKRSRETTLNEVMEAEDVEAAGSVLCFFYTSQLQKDHGARCTAELLVRMMKVNTRQKSDVLGLIL